MEVFNNMSKDDNQSNEQPTETQENEKEQVKLTVKEAADAIGETATTVRNWMRELKPYIPLKKAENGYNLFDEEALESIRQIKQLHREQGYSINQVKTYFDTGGEVFKPINTEEKLQKDIEELKEQMKKQLEFNKVLVERLEQQQTYIDEKLNERDRKLLEHIREQQEMKQQLAIAVEEKEKEKEKPKRVGIFRRLFSK